MNSSPFLYRPTDSIHLTRLSVLLLHPRKEIAAENRVWHGQENAIAYTVYPDYRKEAYIINILEALLNDLRGYVRVYDVKLEILNLYPDQFDEAMFDEACKIVAIILDGVIAQLMRVVPASPVDSQDIVVSTR